jgi:hypothetical protein
MNPEWNYGYLRPAYGFDPVTAVAGAVSAVSGVATTLLSSGAAKEQAKADERLLRLQMLQSQQDAVASQEALKVALAKSAQESAAQAEIAKTVVLGLGAVALIGALLYVGKDYLKAPSA